MFDEDITSDDLVGSSTIDLKDRNLLAPGDGSFYTITTELLYEGAKAGELVLAVRYHP